MNWFLMVQVVVFLIVVLPAIDWGLQEIVKRLFPEWSRGVIASVFGVLIVGMICCSFLPIMEIVPASLPATAPLRHFKSLDGIQKTVASPSIRTIFWMI